LLGDWTDFIVSDMDKFVKSLRVPGMKLGIMMMQHANRRHGVDPEHMAKINPGGLFRVGEYNFSDKQLAVPKNKINQITSIQLHSQPFRKYQLYSETTVFPARALKPEMLVYKARIAIALGIPNITLMSGAWLMSDDYWNCWAKAMPSLRRFHKEVSGQQIDYPVHVYFGLDETQPPLVPSYLPFLSGLPAEPVRSINRMGGEILLISGRVILSENLKAITKLYSLVVIDKLALETNGNIKSQLSTFNEKQGKR